MSMMVRTILAVLALGTTAKKALAVCSSAITSLNWCALACSRASLFWGGGVSSAPDDV